MWDLPGPGLEPVSPALSGGCLTTERGSPRVPILQEEDPGQGGGLEAFRPAPFPPPRAMGLQLHDCEKTRTTHPWTLLIPCPAFLSDDVS